MNDPEQPDERATKSPGQNESPGSGSDPEPTPGEDPGPMGNPAEDEEALRHEQEESAEDDG